VVADGATCGSAKSTVTSKMTGNAAYYSALDAAFGVGRSRDGQKGQRGNRAREGLCHFLLRVSGGFTTPLARESSFALASNAGAHTVGDGRLRGGAPLLDAVTSRDIIISENFLSRCRTEVIDSATPVKCDAPTVCEFSDAFGQHREFTVVVW
jgi:hypothetical protein